MSKRSGRRHARSGAQATQRIPAHKTALAHAWDRKRAHERYLRYVEPLTAHGVTWRELQLPDDQQHVERLVRAHIAGVPDWSIAPTSSGVIAEDAEGAVIAAAVLGAGMFPGDQLLVFVQHLVVEPAWRGRGVGVVTLGILPLIVNDPGATYLGNCAAADAAFYQRAGYTVLHPGDPFPAQVVGANRAMACSSTHYPCWFFKV